MLLVCTSGRLPNKVLVGMGFVAIVSRFLLASLHSAFRLGLLFLLGLQGRLL